MSGHKNDSAPQISVREAAIELLAHLDAAASSTGFARITMADPPNRAVEALRSAIRDEPSVPPPIEQAELAREGIAIVKAGEGDLRPDHVVAIVQAAEAAFEGAAAFSLRWDADIRAIRRWQAGDALPAATRQLLADAAGRFREYEKHHKGNAFRLSCGTDEHRSATEKADRNRLMAEQIEAVLAQGAPEAREPIWPDHADLVVWLLELIEVQPDCPAIGEVKRMVADLETRIDIASGLVTPLRLAAASMIGQLANSLIASSRRTVEAESSGKIIPALIVAWLRSVGRSGKWPTFQIADAIERGEWLPLRGAAIRSERARAEADADMARPIEERRAQLEANVNRYLANATQDAGFDYAHGDMGGVVADLAPGWEYIDTTKAGDKAPTVELTRYAPNEPI